MGKKARLEVLSNATRWTCNILCEVQSNHAGVLSEDTQELLRVAVHALEKASTAIQRETIQSNQ